jgi:HK97 family phage major capsid protein
MDKLKKLEGEIKALREKIAGLYDGHKAADGSFTFTVEQRNELKTLQDELEAKVAERDTLKADLESAEANRKSLEAAAKVNRPAFNGAAKPEPKSAEVKYLESADSEVEKFVARGPFKSLGHFCYATKSAGPRPGTVRDGVIGEWYSGVARHDEAIKALASAGAETAAQAEIKAATGLNEFTDNEGGLLIPIEYSQGIWSRSLEDDLNLLSLIPTIPVAGNNLRVRAYADSSRADGSRMGGVAGYWKAEAEQYTASKPTFRFIDLRLNKLTVLVALTDEIMEDIPAMTSEVTRVASTEFRFKINDALIRGSGTDMPLGLLNAACKVTTTSTAGGSNTIIAKDVDAMWVRRHTGAGRNYVWLGNQAIEPQLAQLNYASTNTGAVWTYVPGGTFGSDMPKLKGKPVYYIEQCEDLGTSGDLILFDPTQIACIVKSTGIKQSVSMHLRFDYDETTFKFSFRMDARPYWEAALTRYKGASSLSPIVVLPTTRT